MMTILLAAAALATSSTLPSPAPYQTPVPATFESRGTDRQAIATVLDNYTKAVSRKDQALFESLLLDKTIPFSGVPLSGKASGKVTGTANFDAFRKAVFEGPPFTQRFQDVHIDQDGPLANVTLVFVNTSAEDRSWGWKTMLLVKVGDQWKIAAEFFTGHD